MELWSYCLNWSNPRWRLERYILVNFSNVYLQLFKTLRKTLYVETRCLVKRQKTQTWYNNQCSWARVALSCTIKQQDHPKIKVARWAYKLLEAKRQWETKKW